MSCSYRCRVRPCIFASASLGRCFDPTSVVIPSFRYCHPFTNYKLDIASLSSENSLSRVNRLILTPRVRNASVRCANKWDLRILSSVPRSRSLGAEKTAIAGKAGGWPGHQHRSPDLLLQRRYEFAKQKRKRVVGPGRARWFDQTWTQEPSVKPPLATRGGRFS